jgi:AmiR/NasT family two-component response regulator
MQGGWGMPNTRVLVVEAKTGQAKGLCTELRGLGYSARSVALSKTEKVKISEAKQPDLIILDIKLEEHVGGIEAVKEINNHLDIPVIYLTAYCDEEILQRAGLANLFGYLLKPHRSEELQACIEVALHRHKQEKQLRERTREADEFCCRAFDRLGTAGGDRSGRVGSF